MVLHCYIACFPESDDDEDITVHRKPHRNAIRDSEEEEVAAESSVHMAEALVLSASSEEEMETKEAEEKGESKGRGAQKSKRISRAPIDSEDSGPEQEKCGEMEEQQQQEEEMKPTKERKKREKSQRHREKKEKRSKAVEKLKKKERFSELNEVSGAWTFPAMFFMSLLLITLCTW